MTEIPEKFVATDYYDEERKVYLPLVGKSGGQLQLDIPLTHAIWDLLDDVVALGGELGERAERLREIYKEQVK